MNKGHFLKNYVIFVLLYFFCISTIIAETTVYITKTGEKYHIGSCSYLKKSKIPINLSIAIENGYTPCSRCKPPTTTTIKKYESLKNNAEEKNSINKYKLNQINPHNSDDIDISELLFAELKVIVTSNAFQITAVIESPPEGINEIETIIILGIEIKTDFKKQVIEYLKTELNEKKVYIAIDNEYRDKNNLLKTYIFLSTGKCFNMMLLIKKYAITNIHEDFYLKNEFLQIEKEEQL